MTEPLIPAGIAAQMMSTDTGAVASAAPVELFTESGLAQAVESHQRARRQVSWLLAFSSIALGALVLALVSMLSSELSQVMRVAAAAALFIGYLILLGIIVLATRVSVDRKRIICPLCGDPLGLIEERHALETGDCEQCGHRIVQ